MLVEISWGPKGDPMNTCMEYDVASGQMYAYTEIPTTSPPGYRRERLIIPLGLWSFPVDEKPIFPFFVDWALQGGASKPRPSNFLSTGIVDWAGWYLVLSTGLAGSQHCVGSVGREIES